MSPSTPRRTLQRSAPFCWGNTATGRKEKGYSRHSISLRLVGKSSWVTSIPRLFFFLALFTKAAIGTTVVVIWTPEHVILGVDGRGTLHRDGADQYFTACKAMSANGAVYVAEGIITSDLRAIIASAGPPARSEGVERLNESIKDSLSRNLRGVKNGDPVRYSQFKSGSPIFSLYTAWPNQDSAALRVARFSLAPDDSILSETKIWSGGKKDDGTILYEIRPGDPKPIPKDWLKSDHVQVVKTVMERLTANDPSTGPPLTFIRVTSTDIEWLEPGKCEGGGANAWQRDQ